MITKTQELAELTDELRYLTDDDIVLLINVYLKDRVEIYVPNEMKYPTDGLITANGGLKIEYLIQMLIGYELEVEMELNPRYAFPFMKRIGDTGWETLSKGTQLFLRTYIILYSADKILQTVQPDINAKDNPYTITQSKRYEQYKNHLLGINPNSGLYMTTGLTDLALSGNTNDASINASTSGINKYPHYDELMKYAIENTDNMAYTRFF